MEVSDYAAKLHEDSFVADLHADTLMWATRGYDMLKKHEPWLPLSPIRNHIDVPRLQEGGVNLQAFGIVTNYWSNKMRCAKRQVYHLHDLVDSCPSIDWALSAEEAEKLQECGKIGVFLGMEGAHPLEGRVENLEWFADKGVRYVGLSHFNSTEAAYSSLLPWNRDKPLTSFGRELIHAMNELGVIVDLAHINRAGFFDAVDTSERPVIVSHTGVYSCYPSSRNIDDEQIMAVASSGGVVGIMFAPHFIDGSLSCSVERVVDHIDHVKNFVGIDYVALGSDFDGFITLPREMKDVRDLSAITHVMLDRGYSEEEVQKVLGKNFLRVYRETSREYRY
ncbi:MAG: dipeptidase [Candidatus Woesearchaeota archaeon]